MYDIEWTYIKGEQSPNLPPDGTCVLICSVDEEMYVASFAENLDLFLTNTVSPRNLGWRYMERLEICKVVAWCHLPNFP